MTAPAPSSPYTLLAASILICMDHDPHCDLLYELRDVPVGIGQMAGSHFATLKTLSEVLPKEHIKTVHTGGPGQRLVARQEGEVQAANLLDPEIPIAEARGLRKLVQGEFLITFWVSPTISQKTLGRFFGALRLAEEALERNTERYLHLWERNVPPALEGDYDYAAFGRGEKLIFEPYSLEMFEDAMQFAQAWGLHEHVRESNYERLVAPLPIYPGRTRNPRGRGEVQLPCVHFHVASSTAAAFSN